MSDGKHRPWAEGVNLARLATDLIAPFVVRSKVVGSIRRRRQFVSDIELLAEPQLYPADLLGRMLPDVELLKRALRKNGKMECAGNRYIRVADFMGSGMKLDLFLCSPPADWFVLLAIRTGPAVLSQQAVTLMRRRGVASQDGHLIDVATGVTHVCTSEGDFFAAAGLPFLPPARRDLPEALVPAS